ncbi:MAG: MFS transporter [Candidatus Promineifilaceae bacterium]|nr:MFS transporter [Candidatus Promineifilaceae bacterium]
MYESNASLSLIRSLSNRSFALLWTGQTFSRVGDFMYQVALAWWVLDKTGSAAKMATVLVFSFAPMILFLLIGGVTVDRFPRLQVMLASDLLRGAIVMLVATLAFVDQLELWQIYIMSLLFGLVDAFFQPAFAAAVPEFVAEKDLPSANSLTSLSIQAGRIAGPMLGALLVGLGGAPFALAINGITFFVAAALLVPLLSRQNPAARHSREEADVNSIMADLREGIGIVASSPWLWISIAVFAMSNVALGGPYSVTLPFLVKDQLGAEVGTLGLLHAVFAAGYILGGIWLGRKARIRRRGPIVYGGLAIAGIMLFAFGLPVPIAFLLLAALINGAALEVGSLAWINSLQELVPQDKLGRVSSMDSLGSFALLPIGYGITGWATELLGPSLVFVLGGGITAVVALLALRHPAIRALD